MARTPILTTGATGALIFLAMAIEFIAVSADEGGSIRFLPPPHAGARSAMILPLFPSPANASGNYPDLLRRRLKGSKKETLPNARMDLHDDLLINGYYTTRLFIGTPPQKFALIVDTGSTVTYVPCSTCDQCGHHQDPKFQPDLSSTYAPVKCNPDCNCDDERSYCVYERQYAEMSTSSGVLGEDIISFGNFSDLDPQRATFGCENVETGDLYSQRADGIMGLGRGDLSIMDQLVGKGVISDSFSLCYGGMEIGGGAMVLGGISPPSDMVFAHSDVGRSPYYNIDLKEIHVGGKALPVNSKVFDERYGTVLDSGTTYAYLPEAAFSSFKDAVMKEVQSLKQIRGPDPNYNDICFSGAGSDVSQLSKSFPTVDMFFGNGQKLALSPENYLFRHSKVRGAYCLGVFQNGRDPTTLLGGILVRNTLVTYDRENSKIGFWKTNCSELWERLHLSSDSPSAPSPTDGTKNQTRDLSPSPSPMPEENISVPVAAETRIGQITFEMSSSKNSSDLKSHVTNLTESIAHQLDLNISQVHFVSLTSARNVSIIKWAIRPAKLGGYISNATATDIITRLSEQRVQLPDSYGNYKFAEWKIEPLIVRSWWQKHYSMVFLVSLVALIATLSASVAWFLWRRRQQNLLAYKPVGEAAPEQELQLQPL